MTEKNKDSEYTCEILTDGKKLIFKVTSNDDPLHPIVGASCYECCKKIHKKIIKVNGGKILFDRKKTIMTNHMFGFYQRQIRSILLKLPNSKYGFRSLK